MLEGALLMVVCFFVLAFIVQWPYDEKASFMKKFIYTLANTTLEFVKVIASLWPNRAQKEERAESAENENPSHSLAEEELPLMPDVPEVISLPEPTSPFFTFYTVGPDMLTYQYPVDTKVYKEITEEGGLIGPAKYASYPGAIEAMRENDNEWFLDDGHEEAKTLLEKDLLTLAKKHGKVGAYSLLGSITLSHKDRCRYWEKGVTLGCPKCMVAYAVVLYTSGRTQDGFAMLKRSADAGEKLGCFLTAISYQYGTLSEMDINKACDYYFQALGGSNDFYIYLNLGALLVENGYYHTALQYFEKMTAASQKDTDDLREYGNFEECMSNYETCQRLLELPYAERAKRVKVQSHPRHLTSIFCKDQHAPDVLTPEHIPYSTTMFEPSPELFDIAPEDMEERKSATNLPAKRETDTTEDFLFLSIPIKIKNPNIHGTQREVLFLEKFCHAELNSYIHTNLIPLRATFKAMGFIFTYLPSHLNDLQDTTDRIGSYHNDYGKFMWDKGFAWKEADDIKAQEYWTSMVPSGELPNDCAGFLLYNPNLEDKDDHTNYEYILFPYRPGTDWARAFREFFTILRGRSIVPIHDTEVPIPLLPAGSSLHISADYKFTLQDNCNQVLTEIKMPTLSKVLYLVLLNHPEGITIKCLIDHKDELWKYYQTIASTKAQMENIEKLCNPTDNSANEKLSRIRSAFTTAMKEKYADDLPNFIPAGKRGELITVALERDRVKYE